MDSDGYPDEMELERIEKWDAKDFPALLDFMEDLHIYKDYIKREVIKEDFKPRRPILQWTFSTGGWSGNESLIYALLNNWMFKSMWYYSWRRGGRYVFRIDPTNVGFKLVSDYCKENKVSRQWINKAKKLNKFEYFQLTPKKVYIRPIAGGKILNSKNTH